MKVLVAEDDPDIQVILRMVLTRLGKCEVFITFRGDEVVPLAKTHNPGLILLGGEVGSHPVLIDFVRKQLEGGEFAVTKIASSALGDRAVLWGAISLALEAIPSVLLPQPAM